MNATAEQLIESLADRLFYAKWREQDHPRDPDGKFSEKPGTKIVGTDDLAKQWVDGFNRVRADKDSATDGELWRAAVFTEMARRTFNRQSNSGVITEQQRDEVWQHLADEHESIMELLQQRAAGESEQSKPLFDQPDAAGEPASEEGMGTGSPVGDEPAPSENLGAGVRHLEDGRAIGTTQLTVDQISFDPGRFQYKIEGISEGVSDKLKDVGTFNPMFAGQLLAWKDPNDGNIYVVNGHHRYELAKRTGYDGPLSVYLVDAPNAQQARARGALANLAEGNGTALDAAKFLKDSGTTVDDLASVGVSLRGSVARDGATLAKLNDRIFYKVASGIEYPNRAMAIARHIDDHDLQNEAYNELEQLAAKGKKLTDGDVEEIAREIGSEPKTTETQTTLFGDETKTKSLRAERAQLKRKLRTDLEQRMRAFGAVTTGGRSKTLSEVGNVLDDQTNQRMAAQAKESLWMFDKLINTKGPINDAITRAAEELAKHPRDSKRIVAQLAELIRPELEAQSGGTGGGGGGDSAGGGSSAAKLFSRSASFAEVIRYQLAERLQYKHKPAKGQMTLFGDSDWDESKHPRDSDGKFTAGAGVPQKGEEHGTGNPKADGERGNRPRVSGRPPVGKSLIDLLEEELSRTRKGTRERPAALPDSDSEPGAGPDGDADQSGDAADGGGVRSEEGDATTERRGRRRRTLDESTDFAAGNYRYHDTSFIDTGVKTKFKQNLAACTVLRDMRLEGRTKATPAEQEVLSKFTGWGSMPQVRGDVHADEKEGIRP